ncbi:MAG TPA: 4-alpha-glucanotransferase, partial [Solirubrobacteraceae bacterium]|nr:4-alpha-glucanotransferase [Solirubrobacteraceae bacterium]
MRLQRTAGVQLHVTSLPGGRLGAPARAFVDWLARAGQSWWQVLPLGPPDRYGSPYKAASAFAAWPALLAEPDAPVDPLEADAFRARQADWVEDWIAFAGRGALADQVRFEREWSALRAYAAERGVRIIGDVPIYVAPRSADHRAHPELFRDDVVAGAPPDAFAATGQLWGNPIYDWPALRRRRYRWWTARLRRTFGLFDLARLDHFRGFVAYWAVPRAARQAAGGRWVRGPGRAVFDAARRALGDELPVIAEDLGVITQGVTRLREALGLPGMAVLQFGFDPRDPHSPHAFARLREHQVLYTGTHDNDTLRGWLASLPPERLAAVRAAGATSDEPWWDLIGLALDSRPALCMLQVQDVLGLGSEARMNLPGTRGGQWRFRLRACQLTAAHAR